jgi:hypothetical protein
MHMPRRLGAAFFGTFWLTFAGCGSAVLAAGFPALGIGFLGVSLAFGLTVLTMALPSHALPPDISDEDHRAISTWDASSNLSAGIMAHLGAISLATCTCRYCGASHIAAGMSAAIGVSFRANRKTFGPSEPYRF